MFQEDVALEAAMKKHNINIDSTSSSSSHGHALSASGFSFNTNSTSTSTLMSGLLILEHLIIWLRIEPYFHSK
jgi:hypothetical protein